MMRRRRSCAALLAPALLASSLWASGALAQEFEYNPPGTLTAGSGQGRFDETVYAPVLAAGTAAHR